MYPHVIPETPLPSCFHPDHSGCMVLRSSPPTCVLYFGNSRLGPEPPCTCENCRRPKYLNVPGRSAPDSAPPLHRWWYFRETKRSPTGRPTTFYDGYPEPVVSAVGVPPYIFHSSVRASQQAKANL